MSIKTKETIESIDTLDLLYDSWDFDIQNRVSNKDSSVLYENKREDIKLNLSYFYQTHLLPQPWWGNIIDPKVIVLALNPSYDPINDEKDERIPGVIESLNNNLISGQHTMNWFKFQDAEATKWWMRTLGDSYNKNDLDLIYKNVGFFNFCGYHRDSFKNVTQKCLIKKPSFSKGLRNFVDTFDDIVRNLSDKNIPFYNDKYLPTQNAIVLHINKLIRSSKTKNIVVIWGYKEWVNAGVKFIETGVTDKLLIVNKYSQTNHNIKNVFKENDEKKTCKPEMKDFIDIKICDVDISNKYEYIKKEYEDFDKNLTCAMKEQ